MGGALRTGVDVVPFQKMYKFFWHNEIIFLIFINKTNQRKKEGIGATF